MLPIMECIDREISVGHLALSLDGYTVQINC